MSKISAIRKTVMESNSRQDIIDEKVKKKSGSNRKQRVVKKV